MALNKSECIIGNRVFLSSSELPLEEYKIAGPVSTDSKGELVVIVETLFHHLFKCKLDKLLNEVEGLALQTKLQQDEELFNKEWEKVSANCADKLKQAAALVREAHQIAQSANVDLQEMYDETKVLERAMGEAGWRTSSWHC